MSGWGRGGGGVQLRDCHCCFKLQSEDSCTPREPFGNKKPELVATLNIQLSVFDQETQTAASLTRVLNSIYRTSTEKHTLLQSGS